MAKRTAAKKTATKRTGSKRAGASRLALCAATASFCVFGAVETASAGERATCRKGGDERVVTVRAPGLVGAACDVSYLQDSGAWESIPFHANADADACAAEARAIVAKLSVEGFSCKGALTAEAVEAAPAPARARIAEGAAPEASVPAAPVAGASATEAAIDDNAPTDEADEATQDTDESVAPAEKDPAPALRLVLDAPQADAADAQDAFELSGGERRSADSVATRPWRATNSPVNLTATLTPISTAVPVQRRAKTAGRFMGATAPEQPIVDPTADGVSPEAAGLLASLEIIDPAGVAMASIAPLDALRAALSVQAAAWSRGDLDAFKDGFIAARTPEKAGTAPENQIENEEEASDDSDDAGFEPFAVLYGADAASGALDIRVVGAEMVGHDAARVYGALSLDGALDDAQGFSVVMRKVADDWRIERP